MGDDSGGERGRTMPIKDKKFAWWTDAVLQALAALGLNQKQLAAEIKASEPRVSRCVTRQVPSYDLLIKISDYLKLPYPAILPETEDEAKHLATQRRLYRRDRQIEQIAAGVAKDEDLRQTSTVMSLDVLESQGPGKRAGKRTAKQRPRVG